MTSLDPYVASSSPPTSVLDELDALEKAATAGPWYRDEPDDVHARDGADQGRGTSIATAWESNADAALIALSRNHLRALIEVARAAQAHVEQRRRHSGVSQWPRLLDAVAALTEPKEQA